MIGAASSPEHMFAFVTKTSVRLFWLFRGTLLLTLLGCSSLRTGGKTECVPPQSDEARAIPLPLLFQLEGTYRFIRVDTSDSSNRFLSAMELTLTRADTLERFYERRLRGYVRTGNRPLVGQLMWGARTSRENKPVVVQLNPASTMMISGFCSMCNDAMLVFYSIAQVGAKGFSGRWNDPQTGIGKLVYKDGRDAPDPEGFFCAFRI